MITLCYAAKGGSGTTVVAATLALTASVPRLLVDLVGDLPAVLGLPDPDGPGLADWERSDAPVARLAMIETVVARGVALLPRGSGSRRARWPELATYFADRDVVIDGGVSPEPGAMEIAERRWLVTRPCYLSLRAAARLPIAPDGVVLVDEPGRALRAADVEAALGAPVVATVLHDPAVARAVDAGLLAARVPGQLRRAIGAAA